MATVFDSFEQFYPKDRNAWRNWLNQNHKKFPGIWLVFYKAGTSKPRLPYDDMVEEALCFGWIDSLPRKLDDERSMLMFTPRKPKSVWSQLNKTRIEKLINDKLMMPAGAASIAIAKQNDSWDTLTASDTAAATNQLPDDLNKLFSKNKKAKENFQQFSFSIRKQFLAWIDSAKRPETRTQRLKQTMLMAAANRKPGLTGFKF